VKIFNPKIPRYLPLTLTVYCKSIMKIRIIVKSEVIRYF